jgi:hypothetical protein
MLLYKQMSLSTLLLRSRLQQHGKSQHSSSDNQVHLGHVRAVTKLALFILRCHHDTRPPVEFRLIFIPSNSLRQLQSIAID